MSLLKQWLIQDGYVKFQEFKNLSNNDPEDENTKNQPYYYKYKARDILKVLKSKVEDFLEDGDTLFDNKVVSEGDIELTFDEKPGVSIPCLLSVLNYELGLNFVECEEVTTGEEYLEKCLSLLEENSVCSIYASLIMAVHNQLAIIWSSRSSFDTSYEHLKKAENEYQKQHELGIVPIYYGEVWRSCNGENIVKDREDKFENLHTLTLYYLAQVYGRLDKPETSARYCHVTLARQMERKAYEPRDWSINCATLSQYYITQDEYSLSRYCLACAELVNKEAIDSFENLNIDDEEDKWRLEEKVYKSRADVYRCWAKYALNLLKDSHAANVARTTDPDATINKKEENKSLEEIKMLVFHGLEVTMTEEQITDKFATDYSTAKTIFVFAIKCLQKSKEFYKLDGYVSDFVEITQDTSQMYKYLSFFDDEYENRCKMHKRRIDMLNAVLIELNPQHFLQICRQLTFEISETYGEMAELKKAIIEENHSKFSASSVKKINFLLLQAIKHYTGFVDSYRHEGEYPSKFEDDDVRGILLSYFCMARLNSKYISTDKQVKLSYMLKEKECYEFIVKYSEDHKDMPNVFEQELEICKEMLGLFNVKMNNLLNSM